MKVKAKKAKKQGKARKTRKESIKRTLNNRHEEKT
jgi:hypothetical protein